MITATFYDVHSYETSQWAKISLITGQKGHIYLLVAVTIVGGLTAWEYVHMKWSLDLTTHTTNTRRMQYH